MEKNIQKMLVYILWVILGFLVFTNFSYASTNYTSTSGKTLCNDTPTSGDNDNSGHKWIPITNNSSALASGNFNCEEHGYWSGVWSNYQNKDTIYNCPDDRYASKLQCYDSSNNVKTCTENGNGWSKYKVYCKLRDDNPPAAGDLLSAPSDNSYLKANNSKGFIITGNANGGSPIVLIKGKFEKYNSPSNYNGEISSDSDNNSSTKDKLETTEDISKVDNNRSSNNYRIYNYKITQACDEAGNCVNDIKTFKYNIYANNIYKDGTTTYSYISGEGNLTSGKVAEGAEQNVNIVLKDRYKNKIVPVYKSDGTNIRKVGIKIDYTNDEYFLDQYSKSGNSGLEIKGITDSNYSFSSTNTTITKDNLESNKNKNTGTYTTKFRVYTPTKTGYDKAWGDFTINSFKAYTQDYGTNSETTFTTNLKFDYKPLYYTQINGDLANYGFIEGITQNGSIKLVKDTSSTINPNSKIYLEFGSGARNISPKLDLFYKSGSTYNPINEGHSNLITKFKENINSTHIFSLLTKLVQKAGEVINSLQKQYLSTHIEYNVNGKTVIYNSDIIGRNNYWSNTFNGNTTQVGIKVLGKTHSKKQKDLFNNQEKNDIHILGNITKSSLKRNLRKNIYSTIRNIVGDNNIDGTIYTLDGDDWSGNSGGRSIYSNKVLYYELNGGTIVLGDDLDEEIKGRKTIVIKGGDLYIKSNMHYNNPNKDILGIAVLQNENGNGGNLYIDPNITKIVGTIFVDKSILSAIDNNNDGEISSTTEELGIDSDQSILANQLYIKGQIFSENTIGGSRKNPLICPYFISDSSCNLRTSQKYDLNYLRRYFLYDKNNSGVIGDIVGGISDEAANGGTNYKGTFVTSLYKYAKYPVVIEYNPLVQILPPPLFENN